MSITVLTKKIGGVLLAVALLCAAAAAQAGPPSFPTSTIIAEIMDAYYYDKEQGGPLWLDSDFGGFWIEIPPGMLALNEARGRYLLITLTEPLEQSFHSVRNDGILKIVHPAALKVLSEMKGTVIAADESCVEIEVVSHSDRLPSRPGTKQKQLQRFLIDKETIFWWGYPRLLEIGESVIFIFDDEDEDAIPALVVVAALG